jgi:hypothetical protein
MEMYTGLWWGHLKERDDLKDPGANGKNSIKMEGRRRGRNN